MIIKYIKSSILVTLVRGILVACAIIHTPVAITIGLITGVLFLLNEYRLEKNAEDRL